MTALFSISATRISERAALLLQDRDNDTSRMEFVILAHDLIELSFALLPVFEIPFANTFGLYFIIEGRYGP